MTTEERIRYETRRELLKRRAVRAGVEYPPGTERWPELLQLHHDERVEVRERIKTLRLAALEYGAHP